MITLKLNITEIQGTVFSNGTFENENVTQAQLKYLREIVIPSLGKPNNLVQLTGLDALAKLGEEIA